MLEALIGGESDPEVMAELARGHLRAKLPQLEEALAGRMRAAPSLHAAASCSRTWIILAPASLRSIAGHRRVDGAV